MRVTDSYRYEIFKNNLAVLKARLGRNEEMIASEKKILSPSDDPVGTSQYMKLTTQKITNSQFIKNIQQLSTLGGAYESAANSMTDILTAAKQVATTMASDTQDATTRLTAAEQVETLMEQLVTIANSKVGSTYIFGGKKSDTAAFTLDTTDYSVQFNGSGDVSKVQIANGQTEDMGISGKRFFGTGTVDTVGTNLANPTKGIAISGITTDNSVKADTYTVFTTAGAVAGQVNLSITGTDGSTETVAVTVPTGSDTTSVNFSALGITVEVNSGLTAASFTTNGSADQFSVGSSDMFVTLKNLRDALKANNTKGITDSLDKINKSVDLVANDLSYVGTYTAKLSNFSDTMTNNNTNLQTVMSSIMDVDTVQAYTDYTTLTNAYEASLSVLAKMQQMNILDYFR